jgi:hypothetical protein
MSCKSFAQVLPYILRWSALSRVNLAIDKQNSIVLCILKDKNVEMISCLLSARLHNCLPFFLQPCCLLPTFLFAFLPVYLSACIPPYFTSFLFTCPPTYLIACIPSCFLFCTISAFPPPSFLPLWPAGQACVPARLPPIVSACLHLCLPHPSLPPSLPTYLPACLLACLSACLPVCLNDRLPSCLPTYFPACLPTISFIFSNKFRRLC